MNNLSVQKISKEMCAFGNKRRHHREEKIFRSPKGALTAHETIKIQEKLRNMRKLIETAFT
jgi:hypothetical protein